MEQQLTTSECYTKAQLQFYFSTAQLYKYYISTCSSTNDTFPTATSKIEPAYNLQFSKKLLPTHAPLFFSRLTLTHLRTVHFCMPNSTILLLPT